MRGGGVAAPPPSTLRPKPAHTHMQVVLTNNSTLFFPMDAGDASKAVEQWKLGTPCVSLKPSDGSLFHISASVILFLRQVEEAVAISMVTEQNELNERRAVDLKAQADEAAAIRTHNARIRDMQESALRTQAMRGGIMR